MIKLLANNKKINKNYFIYDSYECGIALKGNEVKSIANTHTTIDQAFGTISRNNEIYLINMYVKPYLMNNTFKKIEPTRKRKLLLNKNEILVIKQKLQKLHLILIPIEVYLKNKHIKVKLALCRHKKNNDKRLDLKKRDMDRNIKNHQ
jgi:SsrA-binding protein